MNRVDICKAICVCVYMYVYMKTYIHTHIWICVYRGMHLPVYVCLCVAFLLSFPLPTLPMFPSLSFFIVESDLDSVPIPFVK